MKWPVSTRSYTLLGGHLLAEAGAEHGQHRLLLLGGHAQVVFVLDPDLSGHILAAEVGVGRQPVGGGRRSLLAVRPRRRRPAGCTCRCRTCTVWRCPQSRAPDCQAFSNATTCSICTALLVCGPRTKSIVLPVYRSCSTPDCTWQPPGVVKVTSPQIAGQYLVAHIAAVAIVVGLAISEQVAVIAILALRIIHAKRLQHVRRWARGHVLAGQLPPPRG